MNLRIGAVIVLISMNLLTACGNTGANVSAIDLFDSTNNVAALDAIIPSTSSFTTLTQGFSSTNPRWIFSAGSAFGGSYLAPAAGIVTDLSTTNLNGTTVTYVRLLHSGLLSTIVYGIQLPNVRAGDGVVSGQIIGNYVSTGQVAFEVRYRDVPVCPLSYVSTAFRQLLTVQSYYNNLCL